MIKTDGLIFDMDGTLWDSAAAVADSWNEVFKKHGVSYRATAPDIHAQMGKPMGEIFAFLLPDEPQEVRDAVEKDACDYENDYLSIHGGMLYPKLEEVLSSLSDMNIPLFIVSNCQDGYIEAFFAAHKLGYLFKDYECWGRTLLPKSENISLVVQRNNLKAPFYVGDTALDGTSSRDAGVPFIYAAYGFGKTDDYDAVIHSISELTELVSH